VRRQSAVVILRAASATKELNHANALIIMTTSEIVLDEILLC
jgi:hypothetical protein